MSRRLSLFAGRPPFPGGIHPPTRKSLAEEAAIEVLPLPKQVRIPVLQHAGAPCIPSVKPRQAVVLGEKIGESEGFIGTSMHASVSGVVARSETAVLPNGRHVRLIPISTAGEQPEGRDLFDLLLGGDWPREGLDRHDPAEIARACRDAGIVGMGGAAFPTHVKLARNEGRPVDTLVVNGCECEPYLTSDARLMVEAPAPIVAGGLLAARAAGAGRILIAVEDNKPGAIEALRSAAAATGIEVVTTETRYPMGGERQLIPAVLARTVPTGGIPLDIGVVVINVATAAALARAVLRGGPMTHRLVTVTGRGVVRPGNLLCPVGTPYRDLLDACGGLAEDAARVVSGGPMMGFTVGDLDTPVTKGTSGLTVLSREEVARIRETACVRCGRCVDVCPLSLTPTKMAQAARFRNWEVARRYQLLACCECGCCGYECPAGIPLVQLIRTGKAVMPRS